MNAEQTALLAEAWDYFQSLHDPDTYLALLRWPGGVVCPFCESTESRHTRKHFRCRSCKRRFTARTGSIFASTPIDLRRWFVVVWLEFNFPLLACPMAIAPVLGISSQCAANMLAAVRGTEAFRSAQNAPYAARDENLMCQRFAWLRQAFLGEVNPR